MGPWSADRVAFNMYQRIEKQKIKTPHERHYILLCLVNTALLEVHAICEQNFRKFKNNHKDCVENYSSPKVLRLLEVLRLFKPEDNSSKNDTMKRISMELDSMDFQKLTRILETKCHSVEQAVEKQQLESRSIVENLDSIVKPEFQSKIMNDKLNSVMELENKTLNNKTDETAPCANNTQTSTGTTQRRHAGGHNQNRPKRRPFRRHHRDQHDASDTLCSIIFCNSNYTARVLFELLAEMSRHDPDLKFIKCQFTTDRVADPITEPKEAEAEHRRQEEVLKRFRMHDCNVLIGTSVLEEGIDVPKCNLVVRWDPPTTYRSYVQCKGRARAVPAYHVVLVASDWRDLINLKPTNEQIKDSSHRLVCSLEHDEDNCLTDSESSGKEENDEEGEDKQINGVSTKQKFVYGSSKGTIKILNPEVITNKHPSKPSPNSSDLILKEIKDETLAIENIKDDQNNHDPNITTNNMISKQTVLNEYDNNSISIKENFNSEKSVLRVVDLEELNETNSSNNMNESHDESVNSLNDSDATSSTRKSNDYKIFNIDEALKELDIKDKDKEETSTKPVKKEVKEKKKFVCLLEELNQMEVEKNEAITESKQFENMDNTTNIIVQQMAEYREIEKVSKY